MSSEVERLLRIAGALTAELMRVQRLAPLASIGPCSDTLPAPLGSIPCGNPAYEEHEGRSLCIFHIYDARQVDGSTSDEH